MTQLAKTSVPAPRLQSFRRQLGPMRAADVEARRVGQGHPRPHQGVRTAPLVIAFQGGEPHPVVHAGDLFQALRLAGGYLDPIRGGEADAIGQVVLPLGVVVLDPSKPVGKPALMSNQKPRVDLIDLQLRLAGVLLLDDTQDTPPPIPKDPAVARVAPGWPFCPPGLRPLTLRWERGGGLLELWLSLARRASSSPIRWRSCSISFACSATRARRRSITLLDESVLGCSSGITQGCASITLSCKVS
jgi:hypothetical protein